MMPRQSFRSSSGSPLVAQEARRRWRLLCVIRAPCDDPAEEGRRAKGIGSDGQAPGTRRV